MKRHSRVIDPTGDSLIRTVYENNDNYVVKEMNPDSRLCLIFFSGNGLYYPNEENEFIDTVVNKNRYEWQNIASDRVFSRKCGKAIFVRDIHKQWYVEGISVKADSVDKTFRLLKALSEGYDIITVGNSAGGYAATLFGCLLKAEKIFSVSGQFVLGGIEKEKLLWKHKDEKGYSMYYDLRFLLERYKGTVFYIFPCRSKQDIEQSRCISGFKNIFFVRIKSEIHGVGLLPENYKYAFFANVMAVRGGG